LELLPQLVGVVKVANTSYIVAAKISPDLLRNHQYWRVIMKDSFELFGTPSNLIMDPIHGGIQFFDHEKAVIDHPLFQRLRYVMQNDVLFLVFPGATHSRFQHCVGTMHLAGKVFKHIIRRYITDASANGAIIESNDDLKNIQYFFYCIRLAGLLHDTGHFPFSHEFEKAKHITEILRDKGVITSLWTECEWKRYYNAIPEELTHEHYSVRCAHEILNDVDLKGNFDINPIDVLSIMETTNCLPSDKFVSCAKHLLSMFVSTPSELDNILVKDIANSVMELFRTIISGELDVDKMDYLLRDSYFTGSKYGVYNLDHLISTLRVGYDLKEPWFGLAIIEKGIGPFEDFISSRFQLYLHVYGHKTVYGLKYLLRNSIDEICGEQDILERIRQHLSDIREYRLFSDTFFWHFFREYESKNPNSYTSAFVNRKRIKHLYSEKDMSDLSKNKRLRKFKELGYLCVSIDAPSKFTKIRKKETLRYLKRDPITGRHELEEIKNQTKLFDRFHDIKTTHFYHDHMLE
jgi:HD superfamily phosphohydrolase